MDATLEGLSLHVTDVERSIEFYSRIPGASLELHRPGEFARFRIGTGSLHLVQLGRKAGFHIELNTDSLNEMYEHLRTAGLEPGLPRQHPWGKSDFQLLDPDGYRLEFGED